MPNESVEPIDLCTLDFQKSSNCDSLQSPTSPLVVVVRVTNACSLRCRFCGFSSDLNLATRQIDWPALQSIGNWLKQFQGQTGRKVLVSWLGGEPFQWSEWIKASNYFANHLELDLGVTTNGLALARDSVRTAAVALFKQITISIDGLAEFHDCLRQVDGLFDKLRTIVAQINQTEGRDRLLLRVNTILTHGNIESFPVFCQEMADWGFNELTFNPLGGNDRPEFYPDNRLQPHQVEQFARGLESLRQKCQSRGLTIRGTASYLQRLLATARSETIPIAECNPGRDFLFIDEQCRISPCSFTTGHFNLPINQLPKIEEHSNVDLPLIVEHFQTVRNARRPAACADCHANHVYAKFG